jgi:hypothetical protein
VHQLWSRNKHYFTSRCFISWPCGRRRKLPRLKPITMPWRATDRARPGGQCEHWKCQLQWGCTQVCASCGVSEDPVWANNTIWARPCMYVCMSNLSHRDKQPARQTASSLYNNGNILLLLILLLLSFLLYLIFHNLVFAGLDTPLPLLHQVR